MVIMEGKENLLGGTNNCFCVETSVKVEESRDTRVVCPMLKTSLYSDV